jgi:hypothetical protein
LSLIFKTIGCICASIDALYLCTIKLLTVGGIYASEVITLKISFKLVVQGKSINFFNFSSTIIHFELMHPGNYSYLVTRLRCIYYTFISTLNSIFHYLFFIFSISFSTISRWTPLIRSSTFYSYTFTFLMSSSIPSNHLYFSLLFPLYLST